MNAAAFVLASNARSNVFVASIPRRWLLSHSTPSWRIEDPVAGFQRIVREDRAREIAMAVLDDGRSFPNAIVLATDSSDLEISEGMLVLPEEIRFLVVDGQHRLWAQHFSQNEAQYACMIHTALSEVEMAKLFLEINDNQKRVPSSLRWDLVKLVRPSDDPVAIAAVEMVEELVTDRSSPLYQRVDMTGEQKEKPLKQGSLAPALKKLLSTKSMRGEPHDDQYWVVVQLFHALADREGDRWGTRDSTFFQARVLRALLGLVPDLIMKLESTPKEVTADDFFELLKRVPDEILSRDQLVAAQGNAGIAAITKSIKAAVLE